MWGGGSRSMRIRSWVVARVMEWKRGGEGRGGEEMV